MLKFLIHKFKNICIGLKSKSNFPLLELMPLFILVTLTITLIISQTISPVKEKFQIITISIFICLPYIFYSLKKIYKLKANINLNFLINCFLLQIFSLWILKSVWFSGTLSIYPINYFFSNRVHADVLSHISLIESIKNYGYPSIMIEGVDFFNYHFGSHYLNAIISKILFLDTIIYYNLIMPLLIIPIYFYVLVLLMNNLKISITKTAQYSNIEIFLFLIIFSGFLPNSFSDENAIWHSTLLDTSYMIGQIFLYIYLYFLIRFNALIYKSDLNFYFFALFSILFIFLSASIKISIGILLGLAIIFSIYLSKNKSLNQITKKEYIFIFFILFTLTISNFIFNQKFGSASVRNFYPFHFYITYINYPILFFIIEFLTIIVILSVRYNILIYYENFQKKYYFVNIFTNALIFCSIISLIPGAIFSIEGGSAYYFSSLHIPLTLILMFVFLDFKQNREIEHFNKSLNFNLFIFIFIFVSTVSFSKQNILDIYHNIKVVNTKNIFSINKNNEIELTFKKQLDSINNLPYKKSSCVIYVTNNSLLFNLYKNILNKRAESYFIQAYTGIPVYNLLTIKNNTLFFTDNSVGLYKNNEVYFGINKNMIINKKYNSLQDFKNKFKSKNVIILDSKLLYLRHEK